VCIAPLDVITGITRFVAFLSSSAIKTQKQKHAALALDKRSALPEIWGKRENHQRDEINEITRNGIIRVETHKGTI
jgi:CRISPR/Cas system CMR-associated protein Cmr5 small subunit